MNPFDFLVALVIHFHHQVSISCHRFLEDAHEVRDERFEVENLLAAELHAVFIEACEVQNLRFDVDFAVSCENLNETLENNVWRNSLRQQLIKSVANLLELVGRLFLENLVCCLVEESLPVDLWDVLSLGERILLNLASLQHENGSSQVSFRFLSDVCGELDGQLKTFLLAD